MTRRDLEHEIAGLSDLPRNDLIGHWRKHYKEPPPKGLSRALLIRAVAYQLQARRLGGLKPKTLRRLRLAASGSPVDKNAPAPATRPALRPGTRLLREWNGRTHQVEVVESGFLCNDKTYRSLSAIARTITGARWSGPRFFGLTGARPS